MVDNPHVPEGFSDREFWTEVLRKWLWLLEQYEEVDSPDPDVAYWYGERPLTGLLGTAAWLVNGWSLEEFGADRWKKRKGELHRAYGDLWLGCNHGQPLANATVEAKICWIEQTNIETTVRELKGKLNNARKQLRQLIQMHRVGTPVSVCYAVPCYGGEKGKERGEEAVRQLETQMRKLGLATANHLVENEITDKEDPARPRYPGVLLVARQEQWRES